MLSEKEVAVLTRYAESCHCSRPQALRRIVKAGLRSYAQATPGASISPNQLSLFHVNTQTSLLDEIPSSR